MLAIIGGTGLSSFQGGEVLGDRSTPYGATSADIIQTSIAGQRLFFLARHGNPHQIPPHKINYRANLWALQQLGVSDIIAVNAVGGISADMPVGAMVMPLQLIDYSYGREHTFFDGDGLDLEHIDFTHPFCPLLRQRLIAAAAASGLKLIDKGVYGVVQGPRLETAAEIDRMESDGCDLVGMTAMPEAALARELSINYASLCLVVNPAAGRSDTEISMADIQRVIDTGMSRVRDLLTAAIGR
ncbi:MAG: 5'-methylthioinosine phosphorylase [Oceanicoccus sp.]|jgi:5'-methylthioinosine phosphorylase